MKRKDRDQMKKMSRSSRPFFRDMFKLVGIRGPGKRWHGESFFYPMLWDSREKFVNWARMRAFKLKREQIKEANLARQELLDEIIKDLSK